MSQINRRRRFEIFLRDNFTCVYCGRSAPAVELHVDHKHPRSKGGSNDDGNLVTACVECNLGKGAEMLTVPRPDVCPHCQDWYAFMYMAIRETPQPGGYLAEFRCDAHFGPHTWIRYGTADDRLTPSEAEAAIKRWDTAVVDAVLSGAA